MSLEMDLLEALEEVNTASDLQNAARYINFRYNVFSTDTQLWKEIKNTFGEKYRYIFNNYENTIIANRFINVLLMKYYPCERTVKYAIVNSLRNKQNTVLFEMPVIDSRVDVCRINGNSYAYEIKTEFDNFKRLKKQIDDYSKVYEYVFVVIPKVFLKEIMNLVPPYCGIRILKHNPSSGEISFYTERKALKSPNLDPYSQLCCLSKEHLGIWLSQKKIKPIPPTKSERISLIIEKYTATTINTYFKKMVKQIYKDNWDFVRSNFDDILPIDIQAFFSSSIDPRLIYLKNIN